MPDGPENVSISLSLPPEYDKRLQRLAAQKGIDVTLLLREWIAADLVQWIPDEAKENRRSPAFLAFGFLPVEPLRDAFEQRNDPIEAVVQQLTIPLLFGVLDALVQQHTRQGVGAGD